METNLKYFSVINNTVKSYKKIVLLIGMHIINLTAFLKNLLLLIASTYIDHERKLFTKFHSTPFVGF